jgi:hypothetical protein
MKEANMSADNGILVKKYNRRWHIWYAFYSDENFGEILKNSSDYKKFETRSEALLYAHDLARSKGNLEYGVTELQD